jgi:hypothetical protein
VRVRRFLDVGADGGEQQQVDFTGLDPGLGQRLECGAGGEVGGQDTVVGDDALLEPVHPAQQPWRDAQGGAVFPQPVLDVLRGLPPVGQVDRYVCDPAVGAHADPDGRATCTSPRPVINEPGGPRMRQVRGAVEAGSGDGPLELSRVR